jgi:hypothetical protein
MSSFRLVQGSRFEERKLASIDTVEPNSKSADVFASNLLVKPITESADELDELSLKSVGSIGAASDLGRSELPTTLDVRQVHRRCHSLWISASGRFAFSCQKSSLEGVRTATRFSKDVAMLDTQYLSCRIDWPVVLLKTLKYSTKERRGMT